ncbi:hypothetical protein EV383_4479 [Pseudonocardia sediminis]|uniref:Uncharacterized protein n=1 Tax=Pseudonocardia sediminis TaxID=1397368 RepID=A0A4Q7V248_PSEST|nr:hypothetical protein EV383_4479 [Pseudonocardia sediminis]
MVFAPPDPPVAPTTVLDPASFPHEPDPAYAVTEANSGAPGVRTSRWTVCVHCHLRYPIAQNWSCSTRVRNAREVARG